MNSVGPQEDRTAPADIRGLTEALTGAFAEGVDLGPRGSQIRALGQSLEAMIDALRLKIVTLGGQVPIADLILNLDQLARMARAARTYGSGEIE